MRNAALIVGAVLALMLLLATAVPPLLDWSRYKSEIVARVEATTGRPVAVDGPISLRLLPSPQLSAAQVMVGNPAGTTGELARIGHLRLDLAFLPLLRGKVRVQALELDRPVITLAHLPDGRANWRSAKPKPEAEGNEANPARRSTRTEPPPAPEPEDERPPFQQLIVHDGRIFYGDSLQVADLDAEIVLGGRNGPFQIRGKANLGGVAVALEGVAEHLTPGRASAATLNLRLPGDDTRAEFSGLVTQLSAGKSLRGHLTAKAGDLARTLTRLGRPAPVPPGPLNLEGDLQLSPEEAGISNLDVTVGDQRVTGSVSAALATTPQMDVRLSAAALDLDKWRASDAPGLGAAPVTAPPATTPPVPAATPASSPTAGGFTLPKGLFASANLAVDSLTWRGQSIRQARLEAVLDQGELMVSQASAQLPGASELAADGSLSADQGRPAFDGRVHLKSADPRALLAWAQIKTDKLSESRLRSVDLASPLKVSWPEIKLEGFRLAVDSSRAQGSATIRAEQPVALALTAKMDNADLDLNGRLAGGRLEDGAFKLSSPQGLKPLLAWGIRLPPALEKLGALDAEGTASGSTDSLAVDFKAQSGTTQIAAKGSVKPNLLDFPHLTLGLGPNTVNGQARADLSGAKPSLTADLSADALVLDSLLGSERTGLLLPGGRLLPSTMEPQKAPVVPAGMVGAGESPFSHEPMDLSALDSLDAKVSLRAGHVTSKGWRLDNAVANAVLQGGIVTLEKLTGKLLGGDFSLTGKLAANGTASAQMTVLGADLGTAKLKAGGMTVTSGRLDTETKLTTQGRSSQEMAAHLNGESRLLVRNGVLDGFDLPAVNRQLGNLRNIGSLLGVAQAGLAGGQTPFSQLTGTFHAENGIITSHDLKLEADGGGATADTEVNLPDWTTRTTIAFHLANAPQTPLNARLEGPLENPRKIIDVNAIQQYLVSQGLGRAMRNKDQAPAPGDGQQPEQPREKNTGKNILKNLLKGLGGQ
ncbi:MAG TPA: AsmA family protein [Magnetospirillum sp.]|jgi:uncharacterized protein involved in outer membrane biogenesis|nr:AsmA family protein [Magnetospirillum sp.]